MRRLSLLLLLFALIGTRAGADEEATDTSTPAPITTPSDALDKLNEAQGSTLDQGHKTVEDSLKALEQDSLVVPDVSPEDRGAPTSASVLDVGPSLTDEQRQAMETWVQNEIAAKLNQNGAGNRPAPVGGNTGSC
jgi:hypothetical protein